MVWFIVSLDHSQFEISKPGILVPWESIKFFLVNFSSILLEFSKTYCLRAIRLPNLSHFVIHIWNIFQHFQKHTEISQNFLSKYFLSFLNSLPDFSNFRYILFNFCFKFFWVSIKFAQSPPQIYLNFSSYISRKPESNISYSSPNHISILFQSHISRK